jgi:CheY-like chemotaxis protein
MDVPPRPDRARGPADEATLDAPALDRLARQGGPGLVSKLLASFRTRTPERLAEARAALADERGADAQRVFHSLKSSAALVGALAIQRDAREAEAALRAGRAADVAGCIARIERSLELLMPALQTPAGAGPPLPLVALVEDNEDNRLLVSVLLAQHFRIAEYSDGISALAGIRAEPPAAVLLDVSLPGMDGLEVLARLRAEPALARVPIVALTAHAMRGDRERLLAAGFDAYVSKPILDESELIAPLERLLERRA